jgi:hypothetical protein
VSTSVERLYDEAVAVLNVLRQHDGEVSLVLAAADSLRKGLLIGAASYFESRVCSIVISFVSRTAHRSILVEQLVRNKAIARQYHTWFSWGKANANQFFGLFGEGFKANMSDRVKESDPLRDSIAAFMELGTQRNSLIHQDYASFPMDKTLDEIYELYKSATLFVEGLPTFLQECENVLRPAPDFLEIQARAYQISEERQRAEGRADPIADWYQAEMDLR